MNLLHTAIFSGWRNGTDLTDVEALLNAGAAPTGMAANAALPPRR